jgi:hypothetical protein
MIMALFLLPARMEYSYRWRLNPLQAVAILTILAFARNECAKTFNFDRIAFCTGNCGKRFPTWSKMDVF